MLAVAAPGLQRLPLHDLHQHCHGKMVPFAGYEMPVSYAPGVLKEHLHTRARASLFDVSHMGQLLIHPRSGATMTDVALALEVLMPIDLVALKPGRQRYGFLTTDVGGIADDLMIANLGCGFLVIVNSARKADDEAHLRDRLDHRCHIDALPHRALLALQGPRAADVLAELSPGVVAMRFMDVAHHLIQGVACWVTRSGYTGEDGFEISVPIEATHRLAGRLLMNGHVGLAGLGARDSLRLEAGLCLHGADIDRHTTPVQAALEWAIPTARRADGARAGDFPGADAILAQLQYGSPERRVGLRSKTRPVRAPAALFSDAASDQSVGRVTSGGFGPSINAPVAMGYVPSALAKPGTPLWADVHGQRIAVTVAELAFIPHRYQR